MDLDLGAKDGAEVAHFTLRHNQVADRRTSVWPTLLIDTITGGGRHYL